MIDLEQEFEILRRMCVKRVLDKMKMDELTMEEADRLLEIIAERMDNVLVPSPVVDEDGWFSSSVCY